MHHDQVVTIQGPSAQQYDVRPGESLVFGTCACADCGVRIRVVPGPGQWLRGVLRVHADHWRLDNLSSDVDFISHDLEDRRQSVRVPAGRVAVAVPFELATVRFGDAREEGLVVFGHEPQVALRRPCAREVNDVQRVRLNPETTYMAVLEELCRMHGTDRTVPTSAQIAATLRGRGFVTSARAVDRHIEYLYRRFFPDEDDGTSGSQRPGWKRRAVASAGVRALRPCGPAPGRAGATLQRRGR